MRHHQFDTKSRSNTEARSSHTLQSPSYHQSGVDYATSLSHGSTYPFDICH